MRSPFPGMDPYIEARGLWEDFHYKLIGEIERTLAGVLPDRYVVRTGERSYIDVVDPAEERTRRYPMLPDVGLWASSAAEPAPSAATTAVADPTAVIMHGRIEAEYREVFLEIYELDPERRLVTCLEVLSPSNKAPGTVGWYQFERKRLVFLKGHANYVEIDLLRRGRRMPMEEPWPASPYYVLVLRKEEAPRCTVTPADFRSPLPRIGIPLAVPDPDLTLDLQPLVDAVYDRSRYFRDIDYRQPLQPPLSAEEDSWWQQQLAQSSLPT